MLLAFTLRNLGCAKNRRFDTSNSFSWPRVVEILPLERPLEILFACGRRTVDAQQPTQAEPSPLATSQADVDPLVEQIQSEIADIVRKVESIAQTDQSADQFFGWLVTTVAQAFGSESVDLFQLDHNQTFSGVRSLDGSVPSCNDTHQALFAQVIDDATPMIVNLAGQSDRVALAPLGPRHLIQVTIDQDANKATLQGYLRFLGQVGKHAREYLSATDQEQRDEVLTSSIDQALTQLHESPASPKRLRRLVPAIVAVAAIGLVIAFQALFGNHTIEGVPETSPPNFIGLPSGGISGSDRAIPENGTAHLVGAAIAADRKELVLTDCIVHLPKEIAVRTAASGWVDTIASQQGATIERGDLVVTLHDETTTAQFEAARLRLKLAQQRQPMTLEFQKAQLEVNEAHRLLDEIGQTPLRSDVRRERQHRLQLAEIELKLIEQQQAERQIEVELCDAELTACRIEANQLAVSASSSGTVENIVVQVGQRVEAGTIVAVLSDRNVIEATAWIEATERPKATLQSGAAKLVVDDFVNGAPISILGEVLGVESIDGRYRVRARFAGATRLAKHRFVRNAKLVLLGRSPDAEAKVADQPDATERR